MELTSDECSRSQIVTLNGKRGSNIKYRPHAFTERGLYMLATVLKSPRAIAATHAIIETFAQVRQLKHDVLALHTEKDKARQKSLMARFGEALVNIVMPDAASSETESSIELNFMVAKFKHTVKKTRRVQDVG